MESWYNIEETVVSLYHTRRCKIYKTERLSIFRSTDEVNFKCVLEFELSEL